MEIVGLSRRSTAKGVLWALLVGLQTKISDAVVVRTRVVSLGARPPSNRRIGKHPRHERVGFRIPGLTLIRI